MHQALSDIRVVEIGTGVAASWCGKVFADLGADVVKVEPPRGDPFRADPGVFAHLNTNKRSAILDAAPSQATALWALIDGVDLVIEAPGIGGPADWGIERDDVLTRHVATSVVAITGFGATGPYAEYNWSGLAAQAFSGLLLANPGGPLRLPMSVEECVVGHTAAFGGLAAVLRARATGLGAFVDCAAVEALAANPGRMSLHLGWEYRGRTNIDPALLTGSATLLPLGMFPCTDGYVAMMMSPQQLGEMLTVLDSDELREAFARADAFARPETKEILDGVLYSWLLTRTRQEITDAAQAVGWPVTPVNEPPSSSRPTTPTNAGSGCTPSTQTTTRCCCPARPTG